MSFIEVKDLKVHYPIRGGFFNKVIDHVYAVDGVSLTEDLWTCGGVGVWKVYDWESDNWA